MHRSEAPCPLWIHSPARGGAPGPQFLGLEGSSKGLLGSSPKCQSSLDSQKQLPPFFPTLGLGEGRDGQEKAAAFEPSEAAAVGERKQQATEDVHKGVFPLINPNLI